MSKNKVFISALLLVLLVPFRSVATLVITGGSWTSNGLPATVTDPDITISGTFIIDVDATFDHCPDIKMAAGAQIIVDDGIIFTANYSHFYTNGNYMWKGIAMRGSSLSGGFIKMLMTTLEDAHCAIDGIDWPAGANQSNFSFELYQLRFNRNFISLRKGATYDTYLTGAINIVHSAEVSCVDDLDATTPVPVNLKSGALYTKPVSGFSFQQVDEVFVGHFHPLSGYVNFSYLNNGIFARHCKLNVVNSSFSEIRPYDTYNPAVPSIPEAYGVGLYQYFTMNFAPVKVRYFLPYYRITGSYFRNSQIGIFSRDAQDVLITAGHFSDLDIAARFAGWKVRFPVPQPGKFKVINSDITNCNQGLDGLSNSQLATTITDNNIQVNFPVSLSAYPGSSHNNTAISINPLTPALSGTTTISDNTISGGKIGIELNMVERASVTGNTIHYTSFLSTIGGPFVTVPLRHGIYIFGGQANDIRANAIKGTAGLYTPGLIGPAHLGTAYEVQHGLTAIGSPANGITCNNTGELYSAFHFGGANLNTALSNNNLETGRNFVTGLFMETWGGGSGLISQQGVSGGAAHFNEFDGNYNYPGGYQTVCDGGTDGSRSPFLYASGSTPTPSPNFGFIPLQIFGTASSSIVSTPCAPPLRLTGNGNTGSTEEPIDQGSLGWAFAIAADSLYGAEPFAPFLRFQSQSFLYAYLAQRPTLRTAYADLNTFYNSAAGSPVALLYTADSIVREADTATGPDSLHIAMALNALSGIGSNIPFAGLEAELRSLCLGKLLVDSSAYDSTERAHLEYLASLCPGVEGMGVYLARNLVRGWRDTLYSDDTACTAAGWGTMRTTKGSMWAEGSLPVPKNAAGNKSKIVPNPAAGTTSLLVEQALQHNSEIKVYDINGRIAQRFVLPAGKRRETIDLSKLPAGLYLYVNEDATIKGKLIVQ